jgi:AraC-like DNA-binding protein
VLIARGHKTVGLADLRWAFTFVPGVWCVVVERTGLVLDTRFMAPGPDPAQPRRCLYLLLEGSWVVHEPVPLRVVAPCAFVVTEAQLWGAAGSFPFTFSAQGRPFCAIEIHARDPDILRSTGERPSPIELDDVLLEAARRLARLEGQDDATLAHRYGALLDLLADRGLIAPAVADLPRRPVARAFSLLWVAIRPMFERLYLSPTLQEVGDASGVSTRQLDRTVRAFVATFGIVGGRWRAATLHIRLRLAVLLLSAEGAAVRDVASAVGYGSPDAMARGFRDAGLPSPGAVQDQLRAVGRQEG